MTPRVVRCASAMCLASTLGATTPVRAQESGIPRRQGIERTLVGALERVDSAANRILLRMADGVEHELIVAGWTRFDGARCPATFVDLPKRTGDDVVVVFTEDGEKRIATAIKCFGPETLKVTEGTLARIDPLIRRVVIRSADGEEAVFHFAETTTFDTGAGLAPCAAFMARQGEQVVAHYTIEGEHRVVFLLRLHRGTTICRLGGVPNGALWKEVRKRPT